MEDEGIKSAFELAMEKISGLPKLTPEEKAEQMERECSPIGTAMAVKYMDGTLADTELPIELKRYDGSRQQIVRRALISSLCREMRLENGQGNARKALAGLLQIVPAKRDLLEKIGRSFFEIVGEFEAAKAKKLRDFVALANEGIKMLGISGSAVRINLNENEQWLQELSGVQQLFEPRLEHIRNTLMRELPPQELN